MDYTALGIRIRDQRKRLGLTQAKMAERLGISCSFMGHIERGTRKMSLDTLVKVANLNGVSVDALLRHSFNPDILRGVLLNDAHKLLLNKIAAVIDDSEM